MYYSYVEIEYIATSFSPTRTDLALKLLRILAVKAEPTLVMGPKYRHKINLTSGKVGTLSQNITQSYQPNSHMWLMLAVLPVIIVSGTLPLVM
jgi:hypothetical protein